MILFYFALWFSFWNMAFVRQLVERRYSVPQCRCRKPFLYGKQSCDLEAYWSKVARKLVKINKLCKVIAATLKCG